MIFMAFRFVIPFWCLFGPYCQTPYAHAHLFWVMQNFVQELAEKEVKRVCFFLGPLYGECKTMIDTYFPKMWQLLQEELVSEPTRKKRDYMYMYIALYMCGIFLSTIERRWGVHWVEVVPELFLEGRRRSLASSNSYTFTLLRTGNVRVLFFCRQVECSPSVHAGVFFLPCVVCVQLLFIY